MARYCGLDKPENIFQASNYWLENCILGRRSVFTNRNLWNKKNIASLVQHYVENLDTGKGKFLQKLKTQLSKAPNESKALAAEMLWLMLLCPTNITPKKKIQTFNTVWELSKLKHSKNDLFLSRDYLSGIGDCGVGYNNHRWRELKYFVCVVRDLLDLSAASRRQLFQSSEGFSLWLERYRKEHGNRQLRHMLLFMLFPEEHDRIFSSSHRFSVVKQLGVTGIKISKNTPAFEIDQELILIRSFYEAKYRNQKVETEGLDFYTSPLNKEWDPNKESNRKNNANQIEKDTTPPAWTDDLTGSEKIMSVKARIGQRVFRSNLITYWDGKCSVSKYPSPNLLIASHIKPWRDSSAVEKVCLFNGLLLTPNIDRVFDKGLISFDDQGKILISEALEKPEEFGVRQDMKISIEKEHLPFLAHHRKSHGFD